MNLALPVILALSAGVALVMQQAVNAHLRTGFGSASWAGLVSYVVGLICMALLVVALRDPAPNAASVMRLPWWAWVGGALGAVYIGLSIILVPQLGTATFVALLIAGQMLASVLFDHYGWFGLAQRSIDLPRIIGAALLVAGVVLIRR